MIHRLPNRYTGKNQRHLRFESLAERRLMAADAAFVLDGHDDASGAFIGAESATANRQTFDLSTSQLVDLQVLLVDQDGRPLDSLVEGEIGYLKVSATDLRPSAIGVFAAGFDLELPEQLRFTKNHEALGDFFVINLVFENDRTVDEFRAIDMSFFTTNSPSEAVIRLEVQARHIGRGRVAMNAGEQSDTEVLVYGIDDIVAQDQVRYGAFDVMVKAEQRLPTPIESGYEQKADSLDASAFPPTVLPRIDLDLRFVDDANLKSDAPPTLIPLPEPVDAADSIDPETLRVLSDSANVALPTNAQPIERNAT